MSFDFGLMVMEACEEFQQGIALVALLEGPPGGSMGTGWRERGAQ